MQLQNPSHAQPNHRLTSGYSMSFITPLPDTAPSKPELSKQASLPNLQPPNPLFHSTSGLDQPRGSQLNLVMGPNGRILLPTESQRSIGTRLRTLSLYSSGASDDRFLF